MQTHNAKYWFGALAGTILLASPFEAGLAQSFASLKAIPCVRLVDQSSNVPHVLRGQKVEIACSDAGRADAAVQVVMQFDSDSGETAPGYGAVLATEQTISSGKVLVQVPDVPNISQHTMNVRVFVTDATGVHSCDAGRIKVY